MRRAVFLTSFAFLALMLAVGPASAALVIDFEQGSVVGGTITYSGGQAIGVNIPVDSLKVTNGATTTFYDLFGAGPSSASDAPNLNGSALVNFNTSTGAFTIVGGVCTTAASTLCPGSDTLIAAGTTLVNGTAASASILAMDSNHLTLMEADTKSVDLLRALGIPTDTKWQLATAQFNNFQAVPGTNNQFTVGSVDIANVAVPEPTSILLLGTVLLGVTQLVRRRARS